VQEIRTLTLSPSLDLGGAVERLTPFAKLRSVSAYVEPGGGGINVSRAVQRVGGSTVAVFAGDNVTGARIEDMLRRDGVPCLRVPTESPTRENVSMWVEEPRENYHFVMPAPPVTEREARACLDLLVSSDESTDACLVASGALPPGVDEEFYARLARAAARRGARVVLDTHGSALRAALEQPLYMIKPNLQEFYELLGSGDESLPLDEKVLAEQAKELLARHRVEVLVITLGEGGALMTTRTEQVRAVAPRVRPVSPVGAGDSFMGVFLQAVAAGKALHEALYRGIAAGASAAKTPASALFTVEELDTMTARTRALSGDA
jgi:6-phosphofructokinase 2